MGLEEEELEPRRGFRPRVDLRALGATAQFIQEIERERKEMITTKNIKERKRNNVCMKNA